MPWSDGTLCPWAETVVRACGTDGPADRGPSTMLWSGPQSDGAPHLRGAMSAQQRAVARPRTMA